MVFATAASDFPWLEPDRAPKTERIESWAGEIRVNLVRLAGLIAFYANHLISVFRVPNDPGIAGIYHLQVTTLVMVWVAGAVALYFALSRRWAWPWLKHFVTVWDLLLVTSLLVLSGGPRSSLSILFFLVIAAAPLRLSLGLVYLATIGSMVGYVFLLGHHTYWVVGQERYYAEPVLQIPRTQQMVFLLALVIAGVLAGQSVRQLLRIAHGQAETETGAVSSLAAVDARRDSMLIGIGALIAGVLLAIGLWFAFTASPERAEHRVSLWLVGIVTIGFVIAVIAGGTELVNSRRLPSARSESGGAK